MPHANEILEKRAEPIARAVLGLLLSGPQWRHRRVETITPLSGTIVRRRVSVDYTVPPEFHDDLRMPVDPDEPGDDDQWVVPLGWLVRRPLVSFDLRDGSGTSVPLLLTDQIASITRDLLLLAAIEGDLDPGDADRADEAIDLAIAASAPQRPEDPAQLVARADGLGLGADFTSLVRLSSHGFLLLAVMPQIAGRQVTKSADRRVPAPRTHGVKARVPRCAIAGHQRGCKHPCGS